MEEHIAASRRFYNSAVLELNNAVEIFPSSVIAGMFGIGSVSGLETRAMAFIPYLLMAVWLCFPLEKIFVRYEKNRSFSFFKGVFTVLLAVLAVSAVISSSFTTYIYGTF